MTFTDDDLRKLRGVLKQLNGFEIHGGFTVKEFESLLARLEAAEKCLPFLGTYQHDSAEAMDLVEAWRKAAGK
jgi:cobyric acid synthase